ncbi:MAG: dihydropteroate synthase [Pseudomonadota bacterium]
MTRTVIESKTKTVVMGFDEPFCVIGERINPTGRKKLNEELEAGDFSTVEKDALLQVACGATVLDINSGAVFSNKMAEDPRYADNNFVEPALMKALVEKVQAIVDVPLCIDSSVPGALENGLAACEGRPLLNSVTGEEERLETVLPLVKKYNVPVVAISNDDTGINDDPDVRFEVAKKIVQRAADHGIPAHDIVVDPLVMPVGAKDTAGLQVYALVRRLREELGVNTTCGASNISFGLPNRHGINNAFLATAASHGMTSAIMNPVDLGVTKKMILDRIAMLRAQGFAFPEEVEPNAVAPFIGLGATEAMVEARKAELAAIGVSVPDLPWTTLAPMLGLGQPKGVPSKEIESIKATDFLMNNDAGGANWIRFNKPPAAAGSAASAREGRRRRRA